MKKKNITRIVAFFGVCIVIVAIGQALGIIKPEKKADPEPTQEIVATEKPIQESIFSTDPTIEPIETVEATKEAEMDVKEVYAYYDKLLTSSENPSYRKKIGNEDLEVGSDEWLRISKEWSIECKEYEEKIAKETAEKFGITEDEVEKIFFENRNSTSTNNSNKITLKHGELLDVTINESTLIIKAKIEPLLTNNQTIKQNYFNVEDIIKNQNGNKFDTIDYWAVAEMQDGSESKVIGFTLSKELIKAIVEEKIFAIQYGDYVDDLYILPSLLD